MDFPTLQRDELAYFGTCDKQEKIIEYMDWARKELAALRAENERLARAVDSFQQALELCASEKIKLAVENERLREVVEASKDVNDHFGALVNSCMDRLSPAEYGMILRVQGYFDKALAAFEDAQNDGD